jgi:hypothetical protein
VKRALACIALVACGGGKGDPAAEAKWTEVSGETFGIKFAVSVPDTVPENKGYRLGRDWWVAREPGPRLTLTPEEGMHAIATVEDLKKLEELSPDRNDMTVLAAEVKPDGRVRWVRQIHFGDHLIVNEWIPTKDARRGIRCTGDWWYNDDPGRRNNATPPPDPKHLALLERFCASVRLP